MNKKKSIWIAVALMLCLSPAALTVAFLNRSVTADNVITFGSVKLKLHETCIDENGVETDFDTNRVINVTADSEQKRTFKVENVGKHPLYVRVSFSIVGVDRGGRKFEATDFMDVEAKSEDWVYKDGYWYYLSILYPREKTKALMTDVVFDINEITKRYPGSHYELAVDAQGVQSENNHENVLQAVGWPKE